MIGQTNIYDLQWQYEGRPTKPCEYSFMRYYGQEVVFTRIAVDEGLTGRIIEIYPYYTYVKTKQGVLVGVPDTIAPVKE